MMNKVPYKVPFLLLKDVLILPRTHTTVDLPTSDYKWLYNYFIKNKDSTYVVISRTSEAGKVCMLCKCLNMFEYSSSIRLLIIGKARVIMTEEPKLIDYMLLTSIKFVEEVGVEDESARLVLKEILNTFEKVVSLSRVSSDDLHAINVNKKNVIAVCDLITNTIDISLDKKYEVLECLDISARVKLVLKFLEEYVEILILAKDIIKETRENLDEKNKEFYLRSERETINKKLGEDTNGKETKLYEDRIKEKNLPEDALKEAENELKRMKRMHSASHEYSVIATFLDWILDLPWNTSTEDMLDIEQARKKLDDDHYGLEKPKKRILEYLAIRKLNPDSRSPILCFVGSPGTGKTSIGRSIAEAMGRKFQRMSLGGVRDEAEIRGHRSTYVGAMPGRIIQSIKRAGTNNPVIMLDEIDKLGSDHRGDPSSALLEALDPEQNFAFSDHYIRVKFDLSKVIFITTANLLETIPPALQDRMEVIRFSGYSQDEKEKIATQFLIPRQLKEHGLEDIAFSKCALDEIINGYTRESGVRNLEREIANVIRGIGCKYIEKDKLDKKVTKKVVNNYLGVSKFPKRDDIDIKKAGIAIGMYYSAVGGGLFFFESVSDRLWGKKPELTVSGNLKDVLKESITVGYRWMRSNRNYINELLGQMCNIDHVDIHMHVPEGATPKDGPSAGAAILVSLVSLVSGVIPKEMTAYTGEITLSGKILPVGGIKEKVIGAHRAGIKNIVMPSWCKNNLDKIPSDIKKDVEFYFVDTMEEVLKIAFGGK